MPSHVQSYYLASANPSPERPRLDSDASCDVCVVGGGITGTSTALHLAEMGYDVVLLEAERIALGASGRSGGQAIVGYARDMGVITALVSKDDARRLWDMSVEAIELVKDLVERHHIPCDLKWGYLHVALKRRQVDELRAMKDEFEGVCEYRGTTLLGRDEIRARVGSERYIGGLYDPRSGHLHPMNYTLGLAAAAEAAGTRIFENSRAIDLDTGDSPAVHTAAGRVRCKYLVLGTNAYLEKLIPQVRSRIMPVGTYIVATEPLGEERARQLIRGDEAVADLNFIVNYYRLSGDKRLLFGGRVSYSGREPADLPATMHRAMLKVFPQLADARSEYVWGGGRGDHHEPDASFRPHRAECILRPRILRSWHRAHRPGREIDGRGHRRQGETVRRLLAHPPRRLSRRRVASHSFARPGHGLFLAPRPPVGAGRLPCLDLGSIGGPGRPLCRGRRGENGCGARRPMPSDCVICRSHEP